MQLVLQQIFLVLLSTCGKCYDDEEDDHSSELFRVIRLRVLFLAGTIAKCSLHVKLEDAISSNLDLWNGWVLPVAKCMFQSYH